MSKKNQNFGTAPALETRNLEAMAAKTGNIYESLVVISKRANQIAANVKEELRQRVIAEQDKYGKEQMTYQGASFDIKEAGVKYDYSNCEDVIWNDIDKHIQELTEQRKEREAFLKTIKERFTFEIAF